MASSRKKRPSLRGLLATFDALSCSTTPRTNSFRFEAKGEEKEVKNSEKGFSDEHSIHRSCGELFQKDGLFILGEETEEESCASSSSNNPSTSEPGLASEFAAAQLSSERFFFTSVRSNSIMEEAKFLKTNSNEDEASEKPEDKEQDGGFAAEKLILERSNAVIVYSDNPYLDFRNSMEEMMAAHFISDCNSLETLLLCYLDLNSKSAHSFIFSAFVDMLMERTILTS